MSFYQDQEKDVDLYSEVKYIDPQTFAQMIDRRANPSKPESDNEVKNNPNRDLLKAIGTLIEEQQMPEKVEKVQNTLVSYMTNILADEPMPRKEVSHFAKLLSAPRNNPSAGRDEAKQKEFELTSSPQAASTFSKKREYIPEVHSPPAQQVRPATAEDVERLRQSMDENTKKLTPKQMAFWERLSAVAKDSHKGKPLADQNMNQVLVKYESVAPEQIVVFDPAKSINLMVPEPENDSLRASMY